MAKWELSEETPWQKKKRKKKAAQRTALGSVLRGPADWMKTRLSFPAANVTSAED